MKAERCCVCKSSPSLFPSPYKSDHPGWMWLSATMLNRCNIFLPPFLARSDVRNHRFLVPPRASHTSIPSSNSTRAMPPFVFPHCPKKLWKFTQTNEDYWKWKAFQSVFVEPFLLFAPPETAFLLMRKSHARLGRGTICFTLSYWDDSMLDGHTSVSWFYGVAYRKCLRGGGVSYVLSDHIEQAIIKDDFGYFTMLKGEWNFSLNSSQNACAWKPRFNIE